SGSKPKNFSDDFLLVTLGAMFEKPDIHAQIWKNQRSVHGPAKVKGWKLLEPCGVQIITFTTTQLILLVEKKYPLTRFTLDRMMNVIRLEVEEESKVSLEFLSFGVDDAMDLKKNMLIKVKTADVKYCCWNKIEEMTKVFTIGSKPRTGLSNSIDLFNAFSVYLLGIDAIDSLDGTKISRTVSR
nr:hypothetical protein [Tanacetum cinerariifolium]